MSTSYIPAEDDPARVWMSNFASKLSLSPAAYMVSPADALGVTNAVNAYAAALAVVQDPATKTKVTVVTKDDTKASALEICRRFAMLIKENAGISDAEKVAAGVRPINTSRDPIPVPPTSPVLNIFAATQGAQTLKYADSSTPETGAKPFGAVSLQLFVAIGDAPTADESAAQFVGNFTKNPIAVAFTEPDNGKFATYFGRWQSRRGDTGPWSAPVSMPIAA